MSKHEQTREAEGATVRAEQETQRTPTQSATAMVRQLLVTGKPDVNAVAAIVSAHPRASLEIFTLLHKTVGNRFASQVLNVATSSSHEMRVAIHKAADDKESRAALGMDASNFEIAPPHDLEPMMQAMLDAEETTLDDEPDSEPRDQEQRDSPAKREPEKSALGEPREVLSFDSPGEFYDSRATVDVPHETEERKSPAKRKRSSWVERAQRYNRAHADVVSTFLEATGTQCVDEATGEVDPQKVARWQVDHGIPPDGRIGDNTVTAAILAK
jgi:hypothetical protein